MPSTPPELALLVEGLPVAVFAVLAVLVLLRPTPSGPARGWLVAASTSVAVAMTGFVVPERLGVDLPDPLARLLIVLLLAFPYLLLRFTATFGAIATRHEALLGGWAVTVLVATLLLPVVPEPGGPLPAWIAAYVAWVLGYWTATSALVVGRLWSAGRGQPTVARRRMQLMALAVGVLTVALLLAAPLGDDGGRGAVAVTAVAAVSGLTFAVGYSPTLGLRARWRRPEERELEAATADVLRATDVDAVAAGLLGPTARIVQAGAAALVDPDGRVVAVHGIPPLTAVDPDGAAHHPVRVALPLGAGHGELVVWTSPYTPFFGPEELGLLRRMATVASLALDRCTLLAEERARRLALEEAEVAAQVAREAAVAANEAKTRFLSRTSHELRTPLNAILGFGQLLELAEAADEGDRRAAGHIVRAGRHLLALIDEVLDLSRVEAGSIAFAVEPVPACELLAEAVDLVGPLAAARGARVEGVQEAAEGRSGPVLAADRTRCRQVLLNLLSNALKYGPPGQAVQVGCAEAPGGRVRLWVRDAGPGIPADRIARLFEPFDRLDADPTAVEGTGLGLAVSRQLVEGMGGHIEVDTAVGRGSTFVVDLPAAGGG